MGYSTYATLGVGLAAIVEFKEVVNLEPKLILGTVTY